VGLVGGHAPSPMVIVVFFDGLPGGIWQIVICASAA